MRPVYIIGPPKNRGMAATWHIRRDGSQTETLCKYKLRQIVGLQDTYPSSGVCQRCLSILKYNTQQEREAQTREARR